LGRHEINAVFAGVGDTFGEDEPKPSE